MTVKLSQMGQMWADMMSAALADEGNSQEWKDRARVELIQAGKSMTMREWLAWAHENHLNDLNFREQFQLAKNFNLGHEPLECNHALNESCPACSPAKLAQDAELPYEQ